MMESKSVIGNSVGRVMPPASLIILMSRPGMVWISQGNANTHESLKWPNPKKKVGGLVGIWMTMRCVTSNKLPTHAVRNWP